MLPLNLSFRKLVQKYIPQLSPEDLDLYESRISLMHQISEEVRTLGSSLNRETLITVSTTRANEIIDPYQNLFVTAHRLYIARRNFAQVQGNFFQFPTSWAKFWEFLQAFWNYLYVSAVTLPPLWLNILTNPFPIGQVIAVLILLILFYFGVVVNTPPQIMTNTLPTANAGVLYNEQIVVDDPDVGDSTFFTIQFAPPNINISTSGFITGTVAAVDTGDYMIQVRVFDSYGAFDSKDYPFRVDP